ncbi:Glutathione S-transferase S1 [Actinomortierella ambigua]|nr:Glutathione S-transferase S1 [Actinomortierella ambigua]
MTPILRPYHDNTASLQAKDSTYTLHYFGFHGLGACPRALLCFGGAKWTNKSQAIETWPEVKPTLPFNTLPNLIETTATGEVIVIPESAAMERYLGKKFGLMGDTFWEETLVDVYYNLAVVANFKFVEKTLPNWITCCERHLEASGNTGHFVSDKFTLADIKTAVVMDTMLALDTAHLLNATASPCLWKLKKAVDSFPAYHAWRKSAEYQSFDDATQTPLSKMMPYDISKSRVFA